MFKSFGKYGIIIVTTALFLVLVLSVLGLNFYMSFQVESNAELVNVAGRQRMLSQRISKSLLDTQAQLSSGTNIEHSLNELKLASTMFDKTISAFKFGGRITGTDGQTSFLNKAPSERTQKIISDSYAIWQPFYKDISITITSLEQNNTNSLVLLKANTDFARQNINKLLKLMNDLTNEQESNANNAASQSRLIQAFGIIIALLCFIIIMYRIFGQLRLADAQTESAKRETKQIFSTVNQGLFLLDKKFHMGEQYSKKLVDIFGDNDISNKSFTSFIGNIVSANDLDNIRRYMKLLFDPHKKEKLIHDLNPLNQVAVQVKQNDTLVNKFLRFDFMRVQKGKEVERVLTSVSDITKEVKLANELEQQSKRNDQQLEMVSVMIEADRTLMPIYLKNTDKALNKINDILKISSRNSIGFKDKARSMTGIIHTIKGESAALSLQNISETCHQIESHLNTITSRDHVDGNNFVEVTVLLNKLMSYNSTLQNLFNNVFQQKQTELKDTSNIVDWGHLTTYAKKVATRQNKNVSVITSGLNTPNLDSELVSAINIISTQLIRNAVSHGIEKPAQRIDAKKDPAGVISIALFDVDSKQYRYMFHDDGSGINFTKLTQRAIEKGLLTQEQSEKASKQSLINLIFSSDISTADQTDEDQGRGAGMSSILQTVKQLGASITVKTNPVTGTSFFVNFPKSIAEKLPLTA